MTRLEELAQLLDESAELLDQQNEGRTPDQSQSMLCLESHTCREWAQTIREELALERLMAPMSWDDEPAGPLH